MRVTNDADVLHLLEIKVFDMNLQNVALAGTASASSTDADYGAPSVTEDCTAAVLISYSASEPRSLCPRREECNAKCFGCIENVGSAS